MEIPFNRPHVTGKEFRYIEEAIKKSHLSGDGAVFHYIPLHLSPAGFL